MPVVSELLCPHGRGGVLWARLAVRGAQEEQEGEEVVNERLIAFDREVKMCDEIEKKPSGRNKEFPLCAGMFRVSVTKKKYNFVAFFFSPPPTRFRGEKIVVQRCLGGGGDAS